MLSNWQSTHTRIQLLNSLIEKKGSGALDALSSKEASILNRKLKTLRTIFNGVKHLKELPDTLVVVDQHTELAATLEARTLNIPIVSIIDTNCDPDLADVIIPGNDDSSHSILFILRKLANSILAGRAETS